MGRQKKQQALLKRQMKKARKAKERVKAKKSQYQVRRKARKVLSKQEWSDTDQTFWLAHGVNYLISDYDQGQWNPLFPEIYEGNLPKPETIAQRILETIEDADHMTQQQKATLAFSMQSREAIYAFRMEAVRLLQQKENYEPLRTCKFPMEPTVWAMFHDLILARFEKSVGESEPVEELMGEQTSEKDTPLDTDVEEKEDLTKEVIPLIL